MNLPNPILICFWTLNAYYYDDRKTADPGKIHDFTFVKSDLKIKIESKMDEQSQVYKGFKDELKNNFK